MLKIALPNKGSLAEGAAQMMREVGYRQRNDLKDLTLIDSENRVEFYYLRPRDIATYIGEGILDLGITGRDLLLDSGAYATEVMPLGFGTSRFRFAAPADQITTLSGLHGKRVATSYPGLLGRYLETAGVDARLIRLDGAVESAIRLGVADAIADVVDTGTTLRKAGLELFGEPILHSEAVLIQRAGVPAPDGTEGLVRRLSSLLVAKNYVMLDYDVPADALARTCEIAPGLEGPTVSDLAKDGWHAVRVMVPRQGAQRLMDDLWEAGARAILVTEIAACRL
ncbi:MAG: ATP phosphoribosyltransferase [Propionibacteriaceae bacterium]|nr:ATP phosphoribosyltransferase [Propionibacteriaceae bacterium]